jgi:hypothetical protein
MSSRVKRNGEVITVPTRLFRGQGSGVFVQRQLASDGRHHAEESRPAEGRLKLWVGTCRKSRRSRSSSTRARRTMRDVPRRQSVWPRRFAVDDFESRRLCCPPENKANLHMGPFLAACSPNTALVQCVGYGVQAARSGFLDFSNQRQQICSKLIRRGSFQRPCACGSFR